MAIEEVITVHSVDIQEDIKGRFLFWLRNQGPSFFLFTGLYCVDFLCGTVVIKYGDILVLCSAIRHNIK